MSTCDTQIPLGSLPDRAATRIAGELKPNRAPRRRPRQRDWEPDDPDEDTALRTERIMPAGERARRRAHTTATARLLAHEAGGEADAIATSPPDPRQGTVVEVSSALCRVEVQGEALLCGLRGALTARDTGFTNVVAVGDQVLVAPDGSGRGVVTAVLPRRTVLARPDVFHHHLQQVLVANADQLLIVAAWRDPHIWLELVDRYLIAAERFRLAPVICVNKTDLAADGSACRAELKPYQDLGYRVLFTSARTGAGLAELRDVLRGRTTVLAGLSGVGKSSLLSAVQPGLHLRVGEVSSFHEGRHTTAQANMMPLEIGGHVIDTPGIREFGLGGLGRGDLAAFYPEISRLAAGCRFADCAHTHEAGCAVRDAAQTGAISAARYHNYKKIHRTLPA